MKLCCRPKLDLCVFLHSELKVYKPGNWHVHNAFQVSASVSAYSPSGWQAGCLIHTCQSDLLWVVQQHECWHFIGLDCGVVTSCMKHRHIFRLWCQSGCHFDSLTNSLLMARMEDNNPTLCYKWNGHNNCFTFVQGKNLFMKLRSSERAKLVCSPVSVSWVINSADLAKYKSTVDICVHLADYCKYAVSASALK